MKLLGLCILFLSVNAFSEEGQDSFKLKCFVEKSVKDSNGQWIRDIVAEDEVLLKIDSEHASAEVETTFMGDQYLIKGDAVLIADDENNEDDRQLSLQVRFTNQTKGYTNHDLDYALVPMPQHYGEIAKATMSLQSKKKEPPVVMGCVIKKSILEN
jgi:hypothetical protein